MVELYIAGFIVGVISCIVGCLVTLGLIFAVIWVGTAGHPGLFLDGTDDIFL